MAVVNSTPNYMWLLFLLMEQWFGMWTLEETVESLVGRVRMLVDMVTKLNDMMAKFWDDMARLESRIREQCAELMRANDEVKLLKCRLLEEQEIVHKLRLEQTQLQFEHDAALQRKNDEIHALKNVHPTGIKFLIFQREGLYKLVQDQIQEIKILKQTHATEVKFLISQREGMDELCADQTKEIKSLISQREGMDELCADQTKEIKSLISHQEEMDEELHRRKINLEHTRKRQLTQVEPV
jgi:hypothetical protein